MRLQVRRRNTSWISKGRNEAVMRTVSVSAQPDGFQDSQRGIEEGREADALQNRIVEQLGLIEDEVDQARLGIHLQDAHEMPDHVVDIFVKQVQRAHADGKKQQSQKQLVTRYQNQPGAMAVGFRDEMGGRVRH